MFDARLRPLIDPPLDRLGRALAARGVTADAVTWTGFAIGMGACAAVIAGQTWLAAFLVLLGRLADGIDGAVARARGKTDFGGFLDITLDFIFYGALPLAFAIADPAANALAAATLLVAYYANGAAFFAFAIMAAKRGEESRAQGEKSLYYLAGLTEGAETIAFMAIVCLAPAFFAPLAYGFAALVAISAAARIAIAARTLRRPAPPAARPPERASDHSRS